ncbi:hypothetical protein D3C78_762550 [compost metagenome]
MTGVAPVVGDRQAAIGSAGDALDPGTRCAAMQPAQAGAFRPMHAALRYMAPDALRYLLHTADHQVLVVVAVGHHHAEDFQHRVGEVRVPAAGAEADLAEHFAVLEAQLGERARGGDEVVEGAVIPQWYQLVPQLFQARYVTVADGLLDVGEPGTAFQRVSPGIGHFVEQLGQVGGFFGVVGLAFQVDHRAARGRGQRVGERFGLQAQLVHVVVESSGRHREAHATQFGDDPVGAVEGLRAQPATQLGCFVHHRLEAQLHQLVGRHQAGDTGAHDCHFLTMALGRNAAQACGVFQPVVEGEGEIRAEDGDGFFTIGGVAVFLVHEVTLPERLRSGRSLSIGDAWGPF